MIWIAPSAKDDATATLEKRLWDAAGQALPALPIIERELNSARPEGLLGISFRHFAEVRFTAQRARVKAGYNVPGQIHHH